MKKHLLLSILLAIVLGISYIFFFSNKKMDNEKQQIKEELVRFSGGEPRSLDPQKSDDTPGMQVLQDLFEGLVRADNNGNPILALANSYTISPDGKTYLFQIRNDAKWSDGSQVTAEDCAFGISRFVDIKVAAPNGHFAEPILNSIEVIQGLKPLSEFGVKALNSNTLEIKLSYPLPQLLDLLTSVNFACVNPSNFDARNGDLKLDKPLLTNSAYKISKRNYGEFIKLEKNPYYYNKDKVYFNKVTYYTTEDMQTQIKMFQTGQADMTSAGIPSNQISYLKGKLGEQVKLQSELSVLFLHLNSAKKPFLNNIKLRQAISMAINRDDITKYLLGTGETSAYDIVPTGIKGYTPFQYNWTNLNINDRIIKAQNLYKEALLSENATTFVVTLLYNKNPNLERVVISIAEMLKKNLGLQVKLQHEEFRTFISDIEKGDYEISINRWNATYADPSQFLNLLISSNPQNLSRMKDSEYDSLMKQAVYEKNNEKRMHGFEKAAEKGLSNYTVIPLFNNVQKFLIKPNIAGYSEKDPLVHLYSQDISVK